jgi:LmbE family N-acetylglucosaminyl deacetylase
LRRRRLACVFAHPDDETFAVGGALARYAAAGVRCDLFAATDGEAGRSSGVSVSSRAELGALRRQELHEAARILGIERVVHAGHSDGALAQVDPGTLIGEIVRFLREVEPEIVLTFGPEGAPNGHRDHRAISRAATAAFFLSGLSTEYTDQLTGELRPHAAARLFYVAWQPPAADTELKLLSVPATATVETAAWREQKLAAFLAHATQRDHYNRFVALGLTDVEYFALACGTPQPQPMISDLFDGLTG